MEDTFGFKWQYNLKLILGIRCSKFILFKSQEMSQSILFSHIGAHKILIHLFKIEHKLRYDREAQ